MPIIPKQKLNRSLWEDLHRRRALAQNQILILSTFQRIYGDSKYEALYAEWNQNKQTPLPQLHSSTRLFSFSTCFIEQKFDLLGNL